MNIQLPRDMGPAARRQSGPHLPRLSFAASRAASTEGAYDPANPQGVDRLIKSHQDAGLRPQPGQSLCRDSARSGAISWPAGRSRACDRQAAQIFRRGADHVGHGLASGTAARRTRSRPSAPSRSARNIRSDSAIRRSPPRRSARFSASTAPGSTGSTSPRCTAAASCTSAGPPIAPIPIPASPPSAREPAANSLLCGSSAAGCPAERRRRWPMRA